MLDITAAGAEEDEDGDGDPGLPSAIPSAWRENRTRGSFWCSSIWTGRLESTAATTAVALGFRVMGRSREREKESGE